MKLSILWLTLVHPIKATTAAIMPCGLSTTPCPSGCWNMEGIVAIDGTRLCWPTPPGYFSPPEQDERFPCEAGQHTDQIGNSHCLLCPPGAIAPTVASTHCQPCRAGSYNPEDGASQCLPCDSGIYDGQGSDFILTIAGVQYCVEPVRSQAPTSSTTESIKSSNPFVEGVTDATPTQSPSLGPSIKMEQASISEPPSSTLPGHDMDGTETEIYTTHPPNSNLNTESEHVLIPPDATQSPSSPISLPTLGEQDPKRDKTRHTLKSWHFMVILGGIVLLSILGKRACRDHHRRNGRKKPIPPPRTERNPWLPCESGGPNTSFSSNTQMKGKDIEDGNLI